MHEQRGQARADASVQQGAAAGAVRGPPGPDGEAPVLPWLRLLLHGGKHPALAARAGPQRGPGPWRSACARTCTRTRTPPPPMPRSPVWDPWVPGATETWWGRGAPLALPALSFACACACAARVPEGTLCLPHRLHLLFLLGLCRLLPLHTLTPAVRAPRPRALSSAGSTSLSTAAAAAKKASSCFCGSLELWLLLPNFTSFAPRKGLS